MRATRSACVPSLAWNTMPFSAGSRSSSRTLRSWSQKNLASLSRARSTRSLPSTIAAPPSRATLLATTTKRLASAPSFVVGREVALVRLHRDDQHLGRHVHELRVDRAQHRHRPFDQARHLVEQAVVGLQRHLRLGAELLGARQHDLLALGRIEHHVRRPELGRVVGEARDLDLALAQEAMAARGVAEPDRRHRAARRDLAGQHLAVEQRHDAIAAGAPRSWCRCPISSTWARAAPSSPRR